MCRETEKERDNKKNKINQTSRISMTPSGNLAHLYLEFQNKRRDLGLEKY